MAWNMCKEMGWIGKNVLKIGACMEKARITKNNTNTSKEYTFYRARTIQQPFKTF